MSDTIPDEHQRRALLKDTFNAVSAGYDNKALRFFSESAKYLAACLYLRGDEQVLDVATGTGHAALAVASRIPRGRVTGADFSTGMLEQARNKAASLDIRNVEFLERDMQDLSLPAGGFDAAVCGFGIFFVENMAGLLAHIAAMVRPGGQVAVSTFQEGYFGPLKDLMVNRLMNYGVQLPPQTWKSVATEAGCRNLFDQAGLRNARVVQKNVGYYLPDAEAWWDVIWNAGFRRMVSQLSPSDQEHFREEHLREVASLATSEGIWLDVGVLFTVGRKPHDS
ncbi:MAG: class I SAM-dependent methyltransferase [Nitrospirota bacterium]